MSDNSPSMYAPKYWALWGGLGIIRLMILLPFTFNMWLGNGIGRLFYRFAHKRRHIAEINLQICFPDETPEWRENLARKHFESLGKSLFEMPMSWWSSDKKLLPLREIQGIENLQKAKAEGKGVLMLSAHFTSLEIGGRLLVGDVPFGVMYRKHKNPVIEAMIGGSRDRITEIAISRDNVRALIRRLRSGGIVWYAPDQNSQRKTGLFIDFFGFPASTSSATARLAKMTGAAVVPFKSVRRDDDSGYDLRIEPALTDYPCGDLEQDTQRVNDVIETWVRETPEQYLWVHRRFRTRPQRSDKSPYDPS